MRVKIVLVGYRGTGKSTVAKLLAERLGLEAVSTDRLVEARIGTTISKFVAAHGWAAFRAVEAEIVREVSARDGVVIDTGGGAVLDPANRESLRSGARVFWLTASPQAIAARIGNDPGRPPLTPGSASRDETVRVLAEREPLYRAIADDEVVSETETPAEVAAAIVERLESGHI